MQGGWGTGPGPKWSHDPWYKAQILCWDDKPRRVPSQERKNEFLFSGEVMGGKEGPGDEGVGRVRSGGYKKPEETWGIINVSLS